MTIDRPNGNGPKHLERTVEITFVRGQAETQGTHYLITPVGDLTITQQDTAFDRLVDRRVEQPVDDVCAALGERC